MGIYHHLLIKNKKRIMSLLQDLSWRYATKKMNGQVVPEDKVDYILEAARLGPTSSGIQPFRILVIKDAALKAKIQPIAYNQEQITSASHLLVFAAFDEYTKERVDAPFAQQEQERGLPAGFADEYKNNLFKSYSSQTKDQNFQHAARQAYIALGLVLAAAAEQKVDATPMEGFVNADLDQLLELDKLGLKSVLIVPLGYRDAENDWYVNFKKVRTSKDEFIINL